MKARYRAILASSIAVVVCCAAGANVASAVLPEWHLIKRTFQLTGGSATFETVGGTKMSCASSKGEGEVTGAQTATAKLTFTSCAVFGFQCESTGAGLGEIKTNSVPVELVYLSKARHEAGLVFNYEEPSHEFPPKEHVLAEWLCGSHAGLGARGQIVVPITPVNTSTQTHSTKFAQSKGVQQLREYENAEGKTVIARPKMALFSSLFEEGGLEDSFTMSTTEKLEVKA